MVGRHLSIVHKYMEEEMIPEDVIIATEEIEEAITIKEVDIKAPRTIGNLSIWTKEEIISGILREIQWMHQKNKTKLLLFIPQV